MIPYKFNSVDEDSIIYYSMLVPWGRTISGCRHVYKDGVFGCFPSHSHRFITQSRFVNTYERFHELVDVYEMEFETRSKSIAPKDVLELILESKNRLSLPTSSIAVGGMNSPWLILASLGTWENFLFLDRHADNRMSPFCFGVCWDIRTNMDGWQYVKPDIRELTKSEVQDLNKEQLVARWL